MLKLTVVIEELGVAATTEQSYL